MHSREEVAARIRESASHPLAILFGALGAGCSTPSETARVAREIAGLSNEEEKLAKWVAVLKRDCQELIGLDFLQALRFIISEEDTEMKTVWGTGHYERLEEQGRKRVAKWLLAAFQKTITEIGVDLVVKIKPGFYGFVEVCKEEGKSEIKIYVIMNLPENHEEAYRYLRYNWPSLRFAVYDKAVLDLARIVGKAYEKEKNASVTIEKNF